MRIISGKSVQVREVAPDTNFGDNIYLKVSSYLTYDMRSYLEFDISSKPSTVNKVLLWMYCSFSSARDRTHEARRITSAWNESTITWNTGQPTTTDTNKAYRTAIYADSGTWVSWDITDLFNDETGSTIGIQVKDQTESTALTDEFAFHSDDNSSNKPYIEINPYYVKTGGNDALAGVSWANAWATINKAATTVPDGSTVHIEHGTYNAEPAGNKIAPQNAGASGIGYKPEPVGGGAGAATVIVEKN